MRVSIFLAFVYFLWASTSAVAEGRTNVHLFQYGSTNAPDTKIAFLDFQDLMSEKLPRLAAELLSERELSNVTNLALHPVMDADGEKLVRPVDRISSLDSKRNYWRETGALALLTGRVKQIGDAGLSIRSTFFLGELGQQQGAETIDLELPFSSATFDTTNDSHSVAILYALAIDISGNCAARADVYFLLSQAKLRADAITEEASDIGQKLAQTVQGALKDFSERCNDR